MPCSDGGYSDEVRVSRDEVQEHTMLEAAMCGILTVLEASASGQSLDYLLGHVDWKEAGIKRKTLELWWKKHKQQDEARRAREAAALNKEQLKARAISKLTAEERAALGLL
jgi:hypothetical protein